MEDLPIRLPVLRRFLYGQTVYEIEPTLEVRTASGLPVLVPFLFDTGTHFTTISISMAEELGIPMKTDRPAQIRGATGASRGYLAPLWFSFPSLPQHQFENVCCFSTYSLKRPLLSLTDVITHFTMRTVRPSKLHPLGSLVLRLRKNHQGHIRQRVAP
jgi:hypothetical protein